MTRRRCSAARSSSWISSPTSPGVLAPLPVPRRPPTRPSPSPDWTALVRQQYVDLLLTNPAATSVATWVGRLQRGETTPVDMIVAFIGSTAIRAAGAARPPRPLGVLRPGPDLRPARLLGGDCCRSSGHRQGVRRHGRHRFVPGPERHPRQHGVREVALPRHPRRARPTTSQHTHWAGQLTARRTTRGGAMATFLAAPRLASPYLRSEVAGLHVLRLHDPPGAVHRRAVHLDLPVRHGDDAPQRREPVLRRLPTTPPGSAELAVSIQPVHGRAVGPTLVTTVAPRGAPSSWTRPSRRSARGAPASPWSSSPGPAASPSRSSTATSATGTA